VYLEFGVSPDDQLKLPKKFSIMSEVKEPYVFNSSLAGYALECLNNLEPRLFKILIESRKSKKGRNDCINFIESRWKGLYNELKYINPTYNDFRIALQRVLKIVASEQKKTAA